MRAGRFLFERFPLLALAAFLVIVSWSIDLWLQPESLTRAAHDLGNLTSAERLNIVAWLVLTVGTTIYSIVKFSTARPQTYEGAFEYYGLGVFIAICFVGFLCFFVWNDQTKGPFAILAGALLATLGWLTSAVLTVRNQQKASEAAARASRKQHTLTILLQMRQNPEFIKHRENINAKFPPRTKLTASDVAVIDTEIHQSYAYDADAPPRISDSIRYVTNYYEFLCAALDEGDLDETLLKKSLEGIMVGYEDKVRLFIDYCQGQDPSVYEYFTKIAGRWREQAPRRTA